MGAFLKLNDKLFEQSGGALASKELLHSIVMFKKTIVCYPFNFKPGNLYIISFLI